MVQFSYCLSSWDLSQNVYHNMFYKCENSQKKIAKISFQVLILMDLGGLSASTCSLMTWRGTIHSEPIRRITWAMKKKPWLFRVCKGFYINPVMWGLFHKPWNKDPYLTTRTTQFKGEGKVHPGVFFFRGDSPSMDDDLWLLWKFWGFGPLWWFVVPLFH